MRLSKLLRMSCLAALTGGMAVALVTGAGAEDRIRWKMHSAFPSSLPILGTAGKRMEKTISDISDGAFQLKLYEPGSLVPGVQYYDAVASGALDAAYGSPGYNVNKEPALAFFTAVPFGPNFGEYNAWMFHGGGYQLYDEINKGFGVKGLICGIIPPEASGWFREPVESLDDLKGLKMRFFGLGARVMEKFGVSTQLLAGGDIYPALELGTIDATEFSMPVMDEGLGFYQIAKHYYFPGWHQPSSFNDVIFPRPKFEALSDLQKNWLHVMCGYNIWAEYAEGEAVQGPAMQRMVEAGVTIHMWPDEILDKFRAAWKQVAEEESAKNPVFKKVYESYSSFRDDYAIWRERGYLKN